MIKIKLLTTVFAAALLVSTSAMASDLTPTTNLDTLKAQIVKYHDSGAYQYDIKTVADQAEQYLILRVNQNKKVHDSKKLAMVLDIDETSLSNYHDLLALSFGGNNNEVNAAEELGDDPAIDPTLQLYHYAINHGVTVLFITGRTEKSRSVTLKNLMQVGYRSVASSTQNCENQAVSNTCLLYLRDGKFLNTSAIPYKSAMRSKITQAGYDIVVNVGDQYSDLAGGYSERTFKYPNYMYYIP